MQCTCPQNTFWNGQSCFSCGFGQIYSDNLGCTCPSGTFFNGSQCVTISNNQCQSIPNSLWNGVRCVCLPGYIFQSQVCVCLGLVVDGECDPCYNKPNSVWLNNICQCDEGYYELNGQCSTITPNPNPSPRRPTCNVATYFDDQQKRCLTCSNGCLSCTTCY